MNRSSHQLDSLMIFLLITTRIFLVNIGFTVHAHSIPRSPHDSLLPRIRPIGPVHTLILIRHGDSIWNGKYPGCQETFTGWTDVPLSPIGILEAKQSGETLVKYAPCGASAGSAVIDALFTSNLSRAKMTAHYCWWAYYEKLEEQYSMQKKYQYYNTQGNENSMQHQQPDITPRQFLIDHRLNERHYGSLQGLVKSETEAGKYGHSPKDVEAWRRSWHAVPPLLEQDDPRRLDEIRKFQHLCGGEENIPRGESLEMVAEKRIKPFLVERVTPLLDEAYLEQKSRELLNGEPFSSSAQFSDFADEEFEADEGGTALIVAHANSLRALIGVLCNVEDDPVALKKLEAMKIPTATPMVIRYRRTNHQDSFWAVDSFSDKNDTGADIIDRDVNNRVERMPVYPLSSIPLPVKRKIRKRFDLASNVEDIALMKEDEICGKLK
ncbi:hypothetical protein ACHAXS_006847 [Conticribra weissflogii]